MFHYQPQLWALLKLAALCVATALFGLWLSTGSVKADGPYPWSDTPLMNEGSSLQPSLPYQGREYRRMQEAQEEQADQQRRDSYQRGQSANPPLPSDKIAPYWVPVPGGGRVQCTPLTNGKLACN